MAPYFVEGQAVCGVSLRIEGVQVIELVSGSGGRSADAMGFGEEEGFEADEEESLPAFGGGDEEAGADGDF